jgi:hypothetical protein
LDRLAGYRRLSYDFFSVGGGFVELRATEGAATTMYWGAHRFAGSPEIRVYSWPEGSGTIKFFDAEVDPWRSIEEADDDFQAWLGRIDPAMTAAWFSSGRIGFAWTVGKDDLHPRPHVHVAILDVASEDVKEQPHLWSREITYAYPAAAPNEQGLIGVSLQYRDPTRNIEPSHAVGVLRGTHWSLVSTREGMHDPANNRLWGDYLSIQPDGTGWIATGYTLQNGDKAENVENLIVRFAVP